MADFCWPFLPARLPLARMQAWSVVPVLIAASQADRVTDARRSTPIVALQISLRLEASRRSGLAVPLQDGHPHVPDAGLAAHHLVPPYLAPASPGFGKHPPVRRYAPGSSLIPAGGERRCSFALALGPQAG